MTFDVPILFIVFNRPDTTAIVFETIRKIRPARLFLAADGPRLSKEGDEERCKAVRKIITEGIDWNCDVQQKFSDVNLGCGKAESSAMLWFFKAVGEGIVIEDDTLPDPSFFHFCKELLDYYRNDETIRMIGGNNYQKGKKRSDGSYYFSGYTHTWGYASWWRAWQDYDLNLSQIDDDEFEKILKGKFNKSDEINYWRKVYNDLRVGKYDTWDFQFVFNMWQKGHKTIIPNHNLVTNIGFGNNATHTKHTNDPLSNVPLESIDVIIKPSNEEISVEADRYFFKNYLLGCKTWKQKVFKQFSYLKKIGFNKSDVRNF